MRILFIAHDSNLYGANRSLLALIEGFLKFDIECFVIVGTQGDLVTRLRDLGVQVEHIPIYYFIREVPTIQLNAKIFKSLHNQLKIVWQAYNLNKRFIQSALRFTNGKKIDIIYSNTSIIDVGAQLSYKLKKPHIWHFREVAELHYGWKSIYGKQYFIRLIKAASGIVANSKFVAGYINESLLKRPISVVYNGIKFSSEFKKLKEKIFLQRSDITFLMLGTITPERRHIEAIETLSKLHGKYKNIKLSIVGAGSFATLVDKVNQLGIKDRVTFTHYIEDPTNLIQESFALLNCSRNEGLGRVTIEAMLLGTPVIGLNSGGTAELINDGENGLLYNEGSENLKSAIVRLVDNKEKYHQIREQAYSYAVKNFSIELYTKSVMKIIDEVIN